MLGIDFLDSLIDEVGLPLVKKGVKALTGIDLDSRELTPEEKQKLLDSQVEIMKIDFEKFKETNRANEFQTNADNQNTANARDNNTKIQESGNASKLAKNAPFILDFVIVGSTILLGILLFMKSIPPENKDIANIMFGALLGLCSTVINYHRGSSSGSHEKQNIISKIQGK